MLDGNVVTDFEITVYAIEKQEECRDELCKLKQAVGFSLIPLTLETFITSHPHTADLVIQVQFHFLPAHRPNFVSPETSMSLSGQQFILFIDNPEERACIERYLIHWGAEAISSQISNTALEHLSVKSSMASTLIIDVEFMLRFQLQVDQWLSDKASARNCLAIMPEDQSTITVGGNITSIARPIHPSLLLAALQRNTNSTQQSANLRASSPFPHHGNTVLVVHSDPRVRIALQKSFMHLDLQVIALPSIEALCDTQSLAHVDLVMTETAQLDGGAMLKVLKHRQMADYVALVALETSAVEKSKGIVLSDSLVKGTSQELLLPVINCWMPTYATLNDGSRALLFAFKLVLTQTDNNKRQCYNRIQKEYSQLKSLAIELLGLQSVSTNAIEQLNSIRKVATKLGSAALLHYVDHIESIHKPSSEFEVRRQFKRLKDALWQLLSAMEPYLSDANDHNGSAR